MEDSWFWFLLIVTIGTIVVAVCLNLAPYCIRWCAGIDSDCSLLKSDLKEELGVV